jgi:hypothetical protein
VNSSGLDKNWNEYHLLKSLDKDDYLNDCSYFSRYNDQEIYVDLETKKLWKLTGEFFRVDEFEKRAVELALKNDVVIDQQPSYNLINLKILKETLVEWWCR